MLVGGLCVLVGGLCVLVGGLCVLVGGLCVLVGVRAFTSVPSIPLLVVKKGFI